MDTQDDSPAAKLAATKPRKLPRRRGRQTPHGLTCTISERRKALGLTLEDVAASVGLAFTSVHQIERGGSVLIHNAHKLAVFFGCQITDLWPALADDLKHQPGGQG